MKKINIISVGILTSIFLSFPLLSLAQTTTADDSFVSKSQDFSAKYLKDSESYYKNGKCSYIKTILDSFDKQVILTTNYYHDEFDLAKQYSDKGYNDLAAKHAAYALDANKATEILLLAEKQILENFYKPCHEGVVVGATQQTVQPTQQATTTTSPTTIVLSDIAGNKNQKAIQYLYDHKVIIGYSDGTFKPYNTVNRAELIKILVGGKGVTPTVDQYKNCFKDVANEWFAPYVCYAKNAGWVQGYSDGTFKPSQNVNKVEALKMLVNSQGFNVPTTVTITLFDDSDNKAWYAPFLAVAKQKGLLEATSGTYGVNTSMTRGEISENIYRAMTQVGETSSQQTTTQPVSPTPAVVVPTPQLVTTGSSSTSSDAASFTVSGTGQVASDKFTLKKGLAIFNSQYTGDGNFIVYLLDGNGDQIALIANEIGSYNATHAISIPSDGTYLFNVKSSGTWSVNIAQPHPTTASTTTSFSGKGSAAGQFFNLSAGLHTFTVTHDGTSNIIVYLMDSSGNNVALLANEIGSYNGSQAVKTGQGIYLFDIKADGNWTVKVQ